MFGFVYSLSLSPFHLGVIIKNKKNLILAHINFEIIGKGDGISTVCAWIHVCKCFTEGNMDLGEGHWHGHFPSNTKFQSIFPLSGMRLATGRIVTEYK